MIEAEVTRSKEDFPITVELRDQGKKITVKYDQNSGFKIIGSRRALTDKMLSLLSFIRLVPAVTKYEDATLVQADAEVTGGVGGTTTILYQIPANKKLYVLQAYLTTDRNGVALPYSVLFLEDLKTSESLQLVFHRYTFVNTEVLVSIIGEINVGFESYYEIRHYCTLNTKANFGFIGVLKDA